jgi:hypothetical protein
MLVIFAMALLLRMPSLKRVVAFRPYLFAIRSLQSSISTSLRMSMTAASLLIAGELRLAKCPGMHLHAVISRAVAVKTRSSRRYRG